MARSPVDEVEHVQRSQRAIGSKIRAARRQGAGTTSPRMIGLNAAYKASVARLEGLIGEDAGCKAVDHDLFRAFNDDFKAETGTPPRHHATRADVKAWLEAREDRAA